MEIRIWIHIQLQVPVEMKIEKWGPSGERACSFPHRPPAQGVGVVPGANLDTSRWQTTRSEGPGYLDNLRK